MRPWCRAAATVTRHIKASQPSPSEISTMLLFTVGLTWVISVTHKLAIGNHQLMSAFLAPIFPPTQQAVILVFFFKT